MTRSADERVSPDATASRGATHLFKTVIGHLIAMAILLVSVFLIPRVLGAESYGHYTALMAVVAIVQIAAACGLQQIADRYLAPLWHDPSRRREARDLASSIWTFRLGLTVLAGIVTGLWLGSSPIEWGRGVLVAAALVTVLRTAQEATQGLFLPLGRVGRMMTFQILQAAGVLAIVLSLFSSDGLAGVFRALSWLHGILFVVAAGLLLRLVPLRPVGRPWQALRPYLGYGLSSFGAVLAGIFQQRFAVYALGVWVAARQAGLFAVGLQFYAAALGLFLAVRRALIPVLAEIEAAKDDDRLRVWGERMMRYSASLTSTLFAGWVFVGEDLLRLLISREFVPSYTPATLLLASLVLYCTGACCDALLLIRHRADRVALMAAVHTVVVLSGMGMAILYGSDRVAVHVAFAYLGGAAVFFVLAYTTLGRVGGLWLPLGRTLLLIAPAILALAAFSWQADLTVKAAAFGAYLALYCGFAVGLGLLPWDEIRRVVRMVVRTSN